MSIPDDDDDIPPSSTTLKTYFITGLAILLPLALTLAIVLFIFNLLTEPFVGIVKAFLGHLGLFQNGFLFLSSDQVQKVISQVIILLLLFVFTIGLGILGRWFFIHTLIRLWERVVARIPFISSVYKACKDVIRTLFAESSTSFKQVVLVPFPSKDISAIGLVTKDNISIGKSTESLIAVFVPTTPNPTSGFLMLYKRDDLIFLDMKVEDALKYILSCGVISAPLNPIQIEKKDQP